MKGKMGISCILFACHICCSSKAINANQHFVLLEKKKVTNLRFKAKRFNGNCFNTSWFFLTKN